MKYETNLPLRQMQYSNELMHFGIKGQKWGVRRYQNDDGSYTPQGVERYRISGKDRRTFKKQSAKLEKYERNADQSYQMRRAESEKRLAKKNLTKGVLDIGAMAVNKATQDYIMPKSKRQMLSIVDPEVHGFNKIASKINTYALGGAGVARLANATVHGLKAANASRKASDLGHQKALAKRDAQYNKMLKMFEGTAYEDILKKPQSKPD